MGRNKKNFTDETGEKIPYNERIKINFHLLEKFYFLLEEN